MPHVPGQRVKVTRNIYRDAFSGSFVATVSRKAGKLHKAFATLEEAIAARDAFELQHQCTIKPLKYKDAAERKKANYRMSRAWFRDRIARKLCLWCGAPVQQYQHCLSCRMARQQLRKNNERRIPMD